MGIPLRCNKDWNRMKMLKYDIYKAAKLPQKTYIGETETPLYERSDVLSSTEARDAV